MKRTIAFPKSLPAFLFEKRKRATLSILLDDKLNVILGGTRVQVAFLLKFKSIKGIIFTKKRYKKLYRIKSFEELLAISKLNADEIHRLNITGKTNCLL